MIDPYFDLYAAVVALAGGVRVTVPLSGAGLRPDLGAIAAAVTPRTRLILLNTPHNPTGVVLTPGELAGIAAIAREHDLIVISDEAYEHLWYDGHRHHPIATFPGMWERTVTIGSAGKMFSLTGWKVGWASGPADLIGAVRVVRQHLSYVSGGPFQWAVAQGLAADESYFAALRATMASQRDLLAAGLAELGLEVVPAAGTYFLSSDVRPLGFADGDSFVAWAAHEAGVVAIPMSALSDHRDSSAPYARWAFCKSPDTIRVGLQRLSTGLAARGRTGRGEP